MTDTFDNFDEDDFTAPIPRKSARAPQVTPIEPVPQATRWTQGAPNLAEVLTKLTENDGTHPYNDFVGIRIQKGFLYHGPAIGGVDCDGCYCDVLVNSLAYPEPQNVIFKIPNAAGTYDDFFLPGTQVADNFTVLKGTSFSIYIVADMPSALAIRAALNVCVIVTHYIQNIPQICRNLLAESPRKKAVVALTATRASELPAIRGLISTLSADERVTVAIPTGSLSFHELSQKEINAKIAAFTVRKNIADASLVPASWTTQALTNGKSYTIDWPAPIHAASVLNGVSGHLGRHTALPFTSVCAIAQWIVASHMAETAVFAPILALLSLTKGCGKTTTLSAIKAFVPRPRSYVSATPATLFRACDLKATVLMDEVDRNRNLSAITEILNAGHTRENTVPRVLKGVTAEFNPFGFKLIAAIGSLPDTVTDRSIVIPMLRKHRHEKIEKYVEGKSEEVVALRSMLQTFASHNASELVELEPEMPELISDRAVDNWRLIFAIAQRAGSEWLAHTTNSANTLTQGDDGTPTIVEEFVRDLAAIYRNANDSFMTSADLVAELCDDKTKPWATFTRGSRLGFHDLSRLMSKLKLRQDQKHRDGNNLKGYRLERLKDLFDRYSPIEGGEE